ncbi:uroporphyrinogen-III C-methyltransferase [Roseateles asaccharophilus]|uniref:uroporphyrinogen-III C-methyltransferase n=1 Tax=Roseateles asaccharophilus TaxID=582607 RepID=A0ABU2AFI3_9BURK|nr:uroporphyrinogen-III C-methyltransferase [Roseateles asaccharophilus]MDR7335939.1 uroporphyrin-III C-methyltransferase [Roseateles asaccharophilus]
MPAGRVIFVSAGPGAADLITVRGARALAQAQVVLADALADPDLRDLAPQAQWISVGKRGFEHSAKQAEINTLLVDAARKHALVVRLKGGDASIFGRLEEELAALAEAGIDCEIVPGVTAALASAAQTHRPLTRRGRGRSVTLSTAMTEAGELRASRSADTEIFYMAGRQLAALTRHLLLAGWPADTPTLAVSRAGCADALSSEHPLADLPRADFLHHGRPTLVTVGAGAAAATPQGLALPASKIAVSPEFPAPLTTQSCP